MNEPLTVANVLTRVMLPVTVPLVLTTCGVSVTVSNADVMSAAPAAVAIMLLDTLSPLKVSVVPLTVTLSHDAK